jgi:hypothetical protein
MSIRISVEAATCAAGSRRLKGRWMRSPRSHEAFAPVTLRPSPRTSGVRQPQTHQTASCQKTMRHQE